MAQDPTPARHVGHLQMLWISLNCSGACYVKGFVPSVNRLDMIARNCAECVVHLWPRASQHSLYFKPADSGSNNPAAALADLGWQWPFRTIPPEHFMKILTERIEWMKFMR